MIVKQDIIHRYLKIFSVLFIFIGLFFALSSFVKLHDLSPTVDGLYFFVSCFIGVVAYCIIGLFLMVSLQVYGIRMPLLKSVRYSFIINTIGNLVPFGGSASFALQTLILKKDSINAKKAALTRVFHIIFFNISFTLLFTAGFLDMVIKEKNNQFEISIITIIAIAYYLFIGVLYLSVFIRKFRRISVKVTCSLFSQIMRIFRKKDVIDPSRVEKFLDDLNNGFRHLIKNSNKLASFILIIIVYWILELGALYFTFLTMDYNINVGILIVGFSIGQMVRLISIIPAGAGTMEGSMAFTYLKLGVPLKVSLPAIILYRISFLIGPFIISLPLYLNMKRKEKISQY